MPARYMITMIITVRERAATVDSIYRRLRAKSVVFRPFAWHVLPMQRSGEIDRYWGTSVGCEELPLQYAATQ